MKITTSLLTLALLPLTAYAATDPTQGFNSLNDIVKTVTSGVLTSLVGLFAVAAMAAFFFGIVKFILAARNGVEKDMTNGKNFMLWGVIALFVMFSVWGIIKYGQTIFGVTGNDIVIPKILIDGKPTSNSPASSALPTPGSQTTSGSDANAAVAKAVIGTSCKTSAGDAGTWAQGGQSRDYAVFCAADPAAKSSSSGAFNNGCDPQDSTCGNGGAFNNGCDPQDPTCR